MPDIPTYAYKPTDPIITELFYRPRPRYGRALSWWVFGLLCGMLPWLWDSL